MHTNIFSTGFLLPEAEILDTGEETWEAIKVIGDEVLDRFLQKNIERPLTTPSVTPISPITSASKMILTPIIPSGTTTVEPTSVSISQLQNRSTISKVTSLPKTNFSTVNTTEIATHEPQCVVRFRTLLKTLTTDTHNGATQRTTFRAGGNRSMAFITIPSQILTQIPSVEGSRLGLIFLSSTNIPFLM